MFRLPILITIDTEVWAHSPDWRTEGLGADYARDIVGRTPSGDFGIGYQMQVFEANNLRAVFLVESLFADVVGPEHLANTVQSIYRRGHEVQLHAHPEWLEFLPELGIPWEGRKYLHQFALNDQRILLGRAKDNLVGAGAPAPSAFRAGNYGANLDTLRALSSLGIAFDSSHNQPYSSVACRLAAEAPLDGPACLEGVAEYPVSNMTVFGRGMRHAQITAASFGELTWLLEEAWRQQWESVVIVSHSFEMLDRRGGQWQPRGPDPVVVRRFEQLCAWLGANSDRFATVGFRDLPPLVTSVSGGRKKAKVRVPSSRSAVRVMQQGWRRLRPW